MKEFIHFLENRAGMKLELTPQLEKTLSERYSQWVESNRQDWVLDLTVEDINDTL